MPLSLPSMNTAIICDENELETYGVEQEGTSSLRAFVASVAGKKFKITCSNNMTDFNFVVFLHIDGRMVQSMHLEAGSSIEFLGPYKTVCSILPYKFQELQLVDPDLEDAPVAPEMGIIELKAYRCQTRCFKEPPLHFADSDLHGGRVSERSKKAGWHHVAHGDEIPSRPYRHTVSVDYLDQRTGPPYASIKVFYRPRELLRAQGIIPGNDVDRQESPINDRKRTRERGSPGPSRGRAKVKREELTGDARSQRIRALQAELEALKQSGTSVKRELRSPSPIVVRHAGEVVDLTLED